MGRMKDLLDDINAPSTSDIFEDIEKEFKNHIYQNISTKEDIKKAKKITIVLTDGIHYTFDTKDIVAITDSSIRFKQDYTIGNETTRQTTGVPFNKIISFTTYTTIDNSSDSSDSSDDA